MRRNGQGIVEYALIVLLVAVIVIVILSLFMPHPPHYDNEFCRTEQTGSVDAAGVDVPIFKTTCITPVPTERNLK